VVKEIIGWREKVELVDFDNSIIKAKLDTGARTSSLHATHISESEDSGEKYVTFKLREGRIVRNSGGDEEYRPVIQTKIRIGKREMNIEITLTQRSRMSYDMLIGRTALRRKFLVDSGRSYSTKLVKK